MKKQVKRLLSVGLCLALALSVGGGLAACGGDDGDNSTQLKAGDLTPYWLAGKVKGTDGWDDPTDERRFVATETAGVYNLTLDLWKGDQFKIRYVDKGWEDVGGQLNASNNFDEEANGDTETGISGESGTGLGGRNFEVFYEGNYTVSITDGDTPMVTWVRNGDATEKAPIKVTGITVKDGDTAITSLTLKMGATATLTATVAPDNAADKTVTWGVAAAYKDFLKVENGVVTPLKVTEEGKPAKFYVEGADGISVTISVTIIAANAEIVEAESITIPAAEKKQSKHCGETITVTPEILPANTTNKTVTYSVPKDSKVVTITDGVIKAAKPGTVTVTATVGEGANAKTDTFEVTVVRDYYIRGAMYNSWAEVKEFGVAGVVYFTETATAGVYKTESFQINKGQGFQIASVGEDWGNRVAGEYLDLTAIGDYFSVSNAASAKDINCKDTAKYTVTLNLTNAENPVITIKMDEDISDTVTSVVGLGAYGDALSVGWAGTADADKVGFTKGSDDKWTATIEVVISAAGEFQFRCEVDGSVVYIDNRHNATFKPPEGVTATMGTSGNFNATAKAAGTYSVTITISATGDVESIVMTQVELV